MIKLILFYSKDFFISLIVSYIYFFFLFLFKKWKTKHELNEQG